MSLHCAGHLRAWLIEELEVHLVEQTESTLIWAERLTGELLRGRSVPEIFIGASIILQATGFKHFLSWTLQNYPSETIEAFVHIIGLQANEATAAPLCAHGTPNMDHPETSFTGEDASGGEVAAQPGPKSGSDGDSNEPYY